MSIGRGIATFARLSKLLGGNLARVVWGHLANAAERKPAHPRAFLFLFKPPVPFHEGPHGRHERDQE